MTYGQDDVRPGAPDHQSPPGTYPQPPDYYPQPSGYYPQEPSYGYPPPGQPPYPPPYATQPLPQPPPRRRHTAAIAVVGVVAIVVVLVLLLNFVGVFTIAGLPQSGSKGPGPTAGLSYHQAEDIANSTAASRGGTWQVAYASMFEVPTGEDEPNPAPCELSGYIGAESSPGNGLSPYWFMVYLTTPYTYWSHGLFIAVYNGTGKVTTQVDPIPYCPGIEYPLGGLLPSNLSDSPAAMAQAQADGGATFMADNPGASIFATAASPSTSGGAEWVFQYSGDCTTVDSTTSIFEVLLGGSNLTELYHGSSTGTCTPFSAQHTYKVSFGSSTGGQVASGSLYYDNLTISSSPADLDLENLSLGILESNLTLVDAGAAPCFPPSFSGCGAPEGGEWYALLVPAGGGPDAAYPDTASSASWDDSGNAVLSGAVTLEIVSTFPLSGSGDTIVAFTLSQANVTGTSTL